ncbi:hypothetical protein [Actinoplanes sp. N902-109]|uniref:hypothetical protein n=1 Tax=Actinoplanes sp. (strain N902-109) TaxID=649831 RepID=UPI00032965BF|nr:hypothetical protein [Actinoplanes sp. N902-109]AGL17238.1 hypothetical protein L083_3728 [Actinoplanes sp. N902-109]
MIRTATVLALVLTAAAGCGSDPEPAAVAPPSAPVPATPAPTYAQPPGRTCAEIGAALSGLMKVTWKVEASPLGPDSAAAAPGTRQCQAAAASTDHSPPALLSVTLFRPRPRPGTDTPERMLAAVQRRGEDEKCTTQLADPPDGTGYATSCVQSRAATITSASTTLLLESGWVTVTVTAQHQAGDRTARAFVSTSSQDGARSAISMI